jgi:large subunit ribosomal protein L7Ae
MEVPFMIVKDKARLGAIVHTKTAACVALTSVGGADAGQLKILKDLAMEKYNNNPELVRKWGERSHGSQDQGQAREARQGNGCRGS